MLDDKIKFLVTVVAVAGIAAGIVAIYALTNEVPATPPTVTPGPTATVTPEPTAVVMPTPTVTVTPSPSAEPTPFPSGELPFPSPTTRPRSPDRSA